MAKIILSGPLRALAEKSDEIEIKAKNINELISNIGEKYPNLKDKLWEDGKGLSKFINIFVNDENIKTLNNEKTALKDIDIIYIIVPIAGG